VSDKPRRRYELQVTVGADTIEYLKHLLEEITGYLPGNRPYTAVSGGYEGGYVANMQFDENITHESWARELEAYLAKDDTTHE